MDAVTIHSDFGAQKKKICHCFHFSPSICHECMGPDAMIFIFWMLSFNKPAFSLFSFTFIKRLFSSSLSAIRTVSSAYLRLLIFLLVNLTPACESSSPAFHMMNSACKLNKQGDNIQPCHTPFPLLNQSIFPCPILTVAFVLHTDFSGDDKVVWYSHFFKNFPHFVVIHTVKGFSLVNEAEVDFFFGIPLPFLWSSRCWQFDLWFLCLF